MAAQFDVSVIAQLTGLGKMQEFIEKGTDETTPTASTYNYRTIATADTAEALDLGDVSTITCIILYAIDYDVDIDCDYVSAFDADLTAKAGGIPAVIPYPAGTVYVKGESGQTPKYEYIVIGTT
jgi:hypothetical protein